MLWAQLTSQVPIFLRRGDDDDDDGDDDGDDNDDVAAADEDDDEGTTDISGWTSEAVAAPAADGNGWDEDDEGLKRTLVDSRQYELRMMIMIIGEMKMTKDWSGTCYFRFTPIWPTDDDNDDYRWDEDDEGLKRNL